MRPEVERNAPDHIYAEDSRFPAPWALQFAAGAHEKHCRANVLPVGKGSRVGSCANQKAAYTHAGYENFPGHWFGDSRVVTRVIRFYSTVLRAIHQIQRRRLHRLLATREASRSAHRADLHRGSARRPR